jgi:hypothetical protein
MLAANASFSPSAGLAAIARALARTSGTQVCAEVFKIVAAFCGLVLVVLLLFATAALDLSTGFFLGRLMVSTPVCARQNHRDPSQAYRYEISTRPSLRTRVGVDPQL